MASPFVLLSEIATFGGYSMEMAHNVNNQGPPAAGGFGEYYRLSKIDPKQVRDALVACLSPDKQSQFVNTPLVTALLCEQFHELK